MTELTHSPLPWRLSIGCSSKTQDRLVDANDDFIMHVYGSNFLTDEANAHLIVAAVNSYAVRAELLAAAKEVINPSVCDHGNFRMIEEQLIRLQAAIAKAESLP